MFSTVWKCIIGVILLPMYIASGEYECRSLGKNVSCTAVKESDLYENVAVILSKEEGNEIQELQIVNSTILTVKKEMFANFQNIRTLRLTNTSTHTIENGAFEDLVNLEKVFLTDNYLEEINSNVFPSNNSVNTLDLSHNILNNLDNLEVEFFPNLIIMNVSYNRLEYLPESILNKVKEINKFYLIVDNNPWNCLHSNWNVYLTAKLVKAFCSYNTYDLSETNLKVEALPRLGYENSTEVESETETYFCIKYSMRTCLLWAIGGIWIGIIIGNVCRLKKMLFTSPRRYEDKNTQCEFSWREQPFLRPEHSKHDTPKHVMITKVNIPKD